MVDDDDDRWKGVTATDRIGSVASHELCGLLGVNARDKHERGGSDEREDGDAIGRMSKVHTTGVQC